MLGQLPPMCPKCGMPMEMVKATITKGVRTVTLRCFNKICKHKEVKELTS